MADTVKRKYQRHKSNSKQRGIGFHLTYEEWLGLWMELDENGVPYLENRGKGVGKYVMMRYGDTGSYELGNVRIGLDTDNIREALRNIAYTEERNRKISDALKGRSRILSEEHKKNMSEIRKGKKHSEESKRKIGEALRGRKRGPYKKLKKI